MSARGEYNFYMCAKGMQFYCPSHTYVAIPYFNCTIFPFLEHCVIASQSFLQVAFGAVHGTGYGNETGYVALDNIEWDFDTTKEACIIQPPEAFMLMTNFETTIIPTEPPNGNL